jgi:hypothetical protein
VEPVLIAIAVACVAGLVATPNRPGLVSTGIVALLLAIQVSHDLEPVLWMLLIGCIPLTIAVAIAVIQRFELLGDLTQEVALSEYDELSALRWFATFGLAVVWLPIAAPALVLAAAVRSYKRPTTADPVENLVTYAADLIRRDQLSLADSDATAVLGLISGVILGARSHQQRADLAEALDFALFSSASGAEPIGPASLDEAMELAASSQHEPVDE